MPTIIKKKKKKKNKKDQEKTKIQTKIKFTHQNNINFRNFQKPSNTKEVINNTTKDQ